jgi:hypothetical protein
MNAMLKIPTHFLSIYMLKISRKYQNKLSIHNMLDACKKLALRGGGPPANLHAAEWRLDLPRRTCTITYDNGDTIFVNEVQLKSRSPGHDYGRSSPNRNTGRSGIPTIRRLPPASLSLCHHGYNSSLPLIFMRSLRLQSMTRTLSYTSNTTQVPL